MFMITQPAQKTICANYDRVTDLDQLSIWSDKWLLSFNPDKCKVMHVGRSYRFHYSLQQDNTSHWLLETKEERDLGILVTDRLSVSSQCAEAAKKAMKVLGILFAGSSKTWTRNVLSYSTRVLSDHIWSLLFKPGHLILREILNAWKKFSVEPPKLLKNLNHSAMKLDCINWV